MTASAWKVAGMNDEIPVITTQDVRGSQAGASNEKGGSLLQHVVVAAGEPGLVTTLATIRDEACRERKYPTGVVYEHCHPAGPCPPQRRFHHHPSEEAVEFSTLRYHSRSV